MISQRLINQVKEAGTLCTGEYLYTYVKDIHDFIIEVPKSQEKEYGTRFPELINNQVVYVVG